MQIINHCSKGDKLFVASLEDEIIGIYARKQNAAMQRAVEHFKPTKKQRGLMLLQEKTKENSYGRS